MELTAGVSATRGGSLAMPSSRKEWRAVSEHHQARKAVDEDLERSNFGQSGERTMFEQRREQLEMEYSSLPGDGNLDGDFLQQQLHNVSRQRDELQQMEIDLRAQMIVRSEIAGMRNSFETQLKENGDALVKLQEQLHDKDLVVRGLEKKIEEKDRELLVVQRDTEAAWAKEDLLREQNKELSTFRREREHSDAERLQHMKQIHDLQEHLQDRDRQLNEMQDQHRVAQETILYKDEQLREAQAWIARAQEMDALQSQTLQVELRERTEQCHQLLLGWQRQFMEMERFHLHTIQQLQLELADARERSFSRTGERMQQINSDPSQFEHNDSDKLDVCGNNGKSSVLSNGSLDRSSIVANGNMTDHVAGVPFGLPTLVPPGQVTAVHPFIMHQQGPPPSNLPHILPGHFQAMPLASTFQELPSVQARTEGSQVPTHSQFPLSEADKHSVSSDIKFGHQVAVNGQASGREYPHVSQGMEHDSVNHSSDGAAEVEPIERSHLISSKPEQSLKQLASQFHDSLTLDQNHEPKVQELRALNSTISEVENQRFTADEPISIQLSSLVSSNSKETATNSFAAATLSESFNFSEQPSGLEVAKTLDINLLDERSLLTCIVRTIPAGGSIRISSTLPNRLGKMLAPLHWHDYKKKYGKLDDFVGRYPELFVIEGDCIQLREGAQEMIAAKSAVAKFAAAAVTSAPHSSNLASVAVTPMAQTYRPNVKILSKSLNLLELNGLEAKFKTVNNGVSKGAANGKPVVKPPSRATGSASASRR